MAKEEERRGEEGKRGRQPSTCVGLGVQGVEEGGGREGQARRMRRERKSAEMVVLQQEREERSRWCVQREGVEEPKTAEKRAENATIGVGSRNGVRMPMPRVEARCLAKMARGARTKSSNTKHVRHRNGQEWETKDRRMILHVVLLAPFPHLRARSIDGIHELLSIRVEECRRRYADRANERTHR